jgi:hypothetical protein
LLRWLFFQERWWYSKLSFDFSNIAQIVSKSYQHSNEGTNQILAFTYNFTFYSHNHFLLNTTPLNDHWFQRLCFFSRQ